ncbi:MAG TPA: exodeoxyribonuclease III [Alphaproteobacteria bacterium]|nr:exodeoxyribonuclease III [Alphaproteobacteria bacterium]
MKIAAWNVNSVKARIARVIEYLRTAKPDIALLQEIKCTDDGFPRMELEDLGYNLAVKGQKTYNGVAILSKFPLEDIVTELPGDKADDQARYIEAYVSCGKTPLRVASIYLPNGNPVDSEKFDYKLKWLKRLKSHAKKLLANEDVLVLGGDYNVAPSDDDVFDPEIWANDALCRPESRAGYRAILNLGYTDAFRALNDTPHAYTFWDYQAGAWAKDHGLRIDHLLLSPQAADRLQASGIDRKERGKDKASDHAPVWCELTVHR